MNNKKLFELYREMLKISMIEDEIANRYYEKIRKMHTPIHLCNGQEAVAVGVCNNLKPEDVIFSNHRCHGHYLAKGGDINSMIAELYSKKTGCSKGKGGSMHLCDMKAGVALTSAIVAGNVPIATGYALSNKIRNNNNISCVFFGDGATEEGVVYESICFATLKKLPILYICENNKYAINTPLSEREVYHEVSKKFSEIIPIIIEDGNDVIAVYDAVNKNIVSIRDGSGPKLIEFITYRVRDHSNIGDGVNREVRTSEEVKYWKSRNPIINAEKKLIESDELYINIIKKCKDNLCKEIKSAFDYAEQSEFPERSDIYSNVWG